MKNFRKHLALLLVLVLVLTPFTRIQAAADPGIPGLVAHYKFDGDFYDASGNGNDGTPIGNISFVDSVNGKGAKFEGGYIEVSHSDSLNLENGYTFSAWLYKEDSFAAVSQPILLKTNVEKVGSLAPAFSYFFLKDRQSLNAFNEIGDCRTDSNEWVDLQKWSLCTVTADSQNIRFYVDGRLTDSIDQKSVFYKSTGKMYIGYENLGSMGTRLFKGIMDDLKIYDHALTPAEVRKEYDTIANGSDSGKYLVNRPSQLVAFYKFEDNLDDASGYGNNGTAIAADGGLTYVPGVAGKGLKFDGNSYIEVKDSGSLDIDKGLTCSAWMYKEDANVQPIIDKQGSSFYDHKNSSYTVYESYKRAVAEIYNLNDLKVGRGQKETPPAKTWYMLTVTANSEGYKFYINGTLTDTAEDKMLIFHSLSKMIIGKIKINESHFFKGIMDELRLYNYAMTPIEVKNLYNLRDMLDVTAANAELKANETVQLKTVLKSYKYESPAPDPSTGAHKIVTTNGKDSFVDTDITAKATYTSSNPKVLTVAPGGAVTAKAKGNASVIVTYGAIMVVKEFTVK